MAITLTLLACGATRMARIGGFAAPDAALDEGGRRMLASVAAGRWAGARACTSPAAAARETARGLGLEAAVEARLDDQSAGNWQGRTLEEVAATDGAALAAWLAAPENGAPGGETFAAVMDRVASWLDALTAEPAGPVLAVTHPMTIRAALCVGIGMAPAAALRIDAGPLTAATLSFHRGWRLQALAPVSGATVA